jgi:hypothetical protein
LRGVRRRVARGGDDEFWGRAAVGTFRQALDEPPADAGRAARDDDRLFGFVVCCGEGVRLAKDDEQWSRSSSIDDPSKASRNAPFLTASILLM